MSERVNWQQAMRRKTLGKVSELMSEHGGYSSILLKNEMPDFEGYVSLELGCSIRQAKDYIETLRKAAVFHAKHRGGSNNAV